MANAKITTGPLGLDWAVYAGDRNRETFEVLTGDDPTDLTGATVEAQARVSADDDTVALTATVTEVDYALGRFTVEWDGEEVRALLAGGSSWQGVWDLQITETGETLPRTLLAGAFTATHDVTRAALP